MRLYKLTIGAFLHIYYTFTYPLNPPLLLLKITLQIYTHMCKMTHSKLLAALLLAVTEDRKQPELPSWGLTEYFGLSLQ